MRRSRSSVLALVLAACGPAHVFHKDAERGCPTRFGIVVRLPDSLTEEQVERMRVIAAKCPVHRTLDGEVMFDERVERVSLAH